MTEATSTILIVDDVPLNVHILGDTLAGEYKLHIALSGPEALRLAQEHCPDLILLDIMMPGMDGYDVLRELRQIESLAKVPVIFVTALENASDEMRGFELGAVDYITKPYTPGIVKLRVKNQLEMVRQRALLERQNDELKAALARIKRLEGIIPICMYCKKIRDDQNSWKAVEEYLTDHSEAFFSHGICPHCTEEQMKKLNAAEFP